MCVHVCVQLTECTLRRLAEDREVVGEEGGAGLIPANIASDLEG